MFIDKLNCNLYHKIVQGLFSKNTLYLSSLLFFPMISVVSWIHVFLYDFNYDAVWYVIAYIVPSVILAVVLSSFFEEFIVKRFKLTFSKTLLTWAISLITLCVITDLVFGMFAIQRIFLTAKIMPVFHYLDFGAAIDGMVNACPKGNLATICLLLRQHDSIQAATIIYVSQIIIFLTVIVLSYLISSGLLAVAARGTRRKKRSK